MSVILIDDLGASELIAVTADINRVGPPVTTLVPVTEEVDSY